ncbi:MAG: dihydrofolate reductase family protein [Candidatus Dormiibacterota bacterium]|jgi:riboflavin biosynthesis pyrimidine reductase
MTEEALARFAGEHPLSVALDDEGDPPSDPLLRLYGGPLRVRRDTPRLVANFVATADGVTAFGEGSGEGAIAVSLHDVTDRLVMALLRCAADCVLIGAGTLRDDPHHQWTQSTPLPELAGELTAHRVRVAGTAEPPPLAVVSASGALPASHPALSHPEADVLIITTPEGAAHLPALHPRVRVAVAGEAGEIRPAAIVAAASTQLGAVTILCEGGPRLFGQLLAAGLVDELFLTVSPQLAGRSGPDGRPGVVAGTTFAADLAPRLHLRSLRWSGNHLFLRYGVMGRI